MIRNFSKFASSIPDDMLRDSTVSAVQLLCAAIIERSGKEYMTWEEFISHPALFPFRIENVTQADMASCEHLCLERMGDDVVIRLLQN